MLVSQKSFFLPFLGVSVKILVTISCPHFCFAFKYHISHISIHYPRSLYTFQCLYTGRAIDHCHKEEKNLRKATIQGKKTSERLECRAVERKERAKF